MANTGPSTAWQIAKPIFTWAVDLLMPPLCPVCRAPIQGQSGLCGECWSRLHLISAPVCQTCGAPFEFFAGPGQRCGACMADPPSIEPVRSACVYDEGSKALILPLKHADRLDLAPLLARFILVAGREALKDADFLVPVPSHWTRLLRRKANQAAEIARALSALSGVPYAPWAMTRIKRTSLQGMHGGVAGRTKNVRNAFKVAPSAAAQMAGKRVVLVDDVWTTGATVNACGQALLKAGAAQVAAVTFARVVRPAKLDL